MVIILMRENGSSLLMARMRPREFGVLCLLPRVVQILQRQSEVDEDKVCCEVGLEGQLEGKDTPSEVGDISEQPRQQERQGESFD